MSHQVVIDILPLVKQYVPEKFILPQIAQALNGIEDEHLFPLILQDADMVWGSDILGGLSYFGKNQDMEKILRQTIHYFHNMSQSHKEEQFYFFWQLGEYSLLMLYEDYQAELGNPYPAQDNVLCVYFGAWTDDEKLLSVLKQKLYSEDDFWQYGSKGFDIKDKNQTDILEEMKKSVKFIDKSQK